MKRTDYLLGKNLFFSTRKTSPTSLFSFFINLFFFVAALLLLGVLLILTHGYYLIAVGLCLLCVACPLTIISGANDVLEEKEKVDAQIVHELPVRFSRKRVIFGYIKIFFLFWLIPCFIFLIPSKLWICVASHVWTFSFCILKLTEHTWTAFGWKKRMYWLWHGCVYAVLFMAAMFFQLVCRN